MWCVYIFFEKKRAQRDQIIYKGRENNQKTVPTLLLSATKKVLHRFSEEDFGLEKTVVKLCFP